jgi:hypothetical protein
MGVKFAVTVAGPEESVTVVDADVALATVPAELGVMVQLTNLYPVFGEAEILVAAP